MKIAMILPSLSKTGPGIVVRDLCTEYIKLGHQCKIFYFDNIIELDVPCPIEQIKFRQSIDFDKWDIIHTHMLRPNAYVWFHRHKIKKANTLTTLHNPITYKATRTGFNTVTSIMLPFVWRQFIKSHNWTVCLNSVTEKELPKKIRKHTSVIYNGRNIDVEHSNLPKSEIRELKSLIGNYKVIGTISSLTRRKGLDQAIKALPELPDYSLLIIGTGTEKDRLEELALNLNVSNRVHFMGFRDKPTDYLPFIDVFVMCSESEGFPLALIEAAAFGKPAVLSDIPILQSIISTDDGVEFYKYNNIHDFVYRVNEVYASRVMRGNKIREYYIDTLTAEKMANSYIDLYKQIKKC